MPDRSEVMVPMVDDQLGRLALIEAIRANTDAVNRLARHGEGQDKKLDQISGTLAKIDTRLTLLERDTLKSEVEETKADLEQHDKRIDVLEAAKLQQEARLSAIDWVFKNWPGVVGFVGLIAIILAATGKLHL